MPASDVASAMYTSDGVMTSATVAAARTYSPIVDSKLHVWPRRARPGAIATRPVSVSRLAPQRSDIRPNNGCSAVVATAATPKMRPMRAGPTPRFAARWSASTGSTIEMVADAVTTAIAHAATAGRRVTAGNGTGPRGPRAPRGSDPRKREAADTPQPPPP